MAKPPPASRRLAPQGQPDRSPRAVGEYLREKAIERRARRVLAETIYAEEAKVEDPEEGAADPQ